MLNFIKNIQVELLSSDSQCFVVLLKKGKSDLYEYLQAKPSMTFFRQYGSADNTDIKLDDESLLQFLQTKMKPQYPGYGL